MRQGTSNKEQWKMGFKPGGFPRGKSKEKLFFLCSLDKARRTGGGGEPPLYGSADLFNREFANLRWRNQRYFNVTR
jgi:hypothetical protein